MCVQNCQYTMAAKIIDRFLYLSHHMHFGGDDGILYAVLPQTSTAINRMPRRSSVILCVCPHESHLLVICCELLSYSDYLNHSMCMITVFQLL